MTAPRFLDLPTRPAKPRRTGVTFVIDGGLAVDEVGALLTVNAGSVDVWKLGWGSAYLDHHLGEKLSVLKANDVRSCPGGTLLEVATLQGVTDECLDWVQEAGFDCIEVSDGLDRLERETKAGLIRRAASRLTVIAEVGAKDPHAMMVPQRWVDLALADLDAGASWLITEGRESGTVGIYRPDGSVREDVVDALLDQIGPGRIVFEAPRREQQAWFIRHCGTEVNLANVAPREVSGLEALRVGLRSDTTMTVLGQPVAVRP